MCVTSPMWVTSSTMPTRARTRSQRRLASSSWSLWRLLTTTPSATTRLWSSWECRPHLSNLTHRVTLWSRLSSLSASSRRVTPMSQTARFTSMLRSTTRPITTASSRVVTLRISLPTPATSMVRATSATHSTSPCGRRLRQSILCVGSRLGAMVSQVGIWSARLCRASI